MPILESKASAKSQAAFNKYFSKGSTLEHLLKTHHIRIFHADYSQVAAGKGFGGATQVAWWYLFHEPEGRIVAHEVCFGQEAGSHEHSEVSFGSAVEEIEKLISEVKQLKETQNDTYEIAFLRQGAIKINAAWLRSKKRDSDYFIPVSPCFYGLEAGKLYPVNEFEPIARAAAQAFLSRRIIANDIEEEDDDLRAG